MSIILDDDVEAAALLMQANFPASKLVGIAGALSDAAPLLWGRYGRDDVAPASLRSTTLAEPAPEAATR